jgi:anti-sigma B factor antagonist
MPGTCTARGEIDVASASLFHDDLFDAIDNSADEVIVIDCSGVTFIDSSGYQVLVEATEYAIRHGHTVSIRNLSPHCAGVLRFYDRDNELHVEEWVEDDRS